MRKPNACASRHEGILQRTHLDPSQSRNEKRGTQLILFIFRNNLIVKFELI